MDTGLLQSFLSNAGNTAIQTGAQQLSNVMSPGLLSDLSQQAMQNAMPALGNGVTSFLDTAGSSALNEGLLSQLGNVLGNEKLLNAVNAGSSLFGAYNQFKNASDMKELMSKRAGMEEDAYKRDVEADKKRQLLNF